MMGQRDLRMLLSLHGSRVSACADAARPHTADGVVTRGYDHAPLPPTLDTQAPRLFPKTAARAAGRTLQASMPGLPAQSSII